MGIHDREYLRDESPRGFQLRAPSSMVMTLIIVNAGFWLADMIFFSTRGPYQHILMGAMACSAESLMYPWLWWQLLTAGFAHDPKLRESIDWQLQSAADGCNKSGLHRAVEVALERGVGVLTSLRCLRSLLYPGNMLKQEATKETKSSSAIWEMRWVCRPCFALQ